MNDTWKPPNPYTLDWHAEQCERYAKGLPIEGRTDEPITGMYRVRMFKDGLFVPFFYYYDNGDLVCEVDCKKIYEDGALLDNKQTIRQAWEYAAKEPIKGEVYDHYLKHKRWPEVLEALSNNPPDDDSAEALDSQIDILEKEAKRLLANAPAKNQEECNQATVLVGKLNENYHHTKDGIDREWLKNRTRMDARITPEVIEAHETYTKVGMSILNSVKRCEIFKRLKQEYQKPFLLKLKAAAERVGEKMPVQHAVLGYPATHLSTQKKARINDFEKCLLYYRGQEDGREALTEFVQKLANAYVRKHKKAPPGCEVVEEDIAS